MNKEKDKLVQEDYCDGKKNIGDKLYIFGSSCSNFKFCFWNSKFRVKITICRQSSFSVMYANLTPFPSTWKHRQCNISSSRLLQGETLINFDVKSWPLIPFYKNILCSALTGIWKSSKMCVDLWKVDGIVIYIAMGNIYFDVCVCEVWARDEAPFFNFIK